MAWIAIDAGTTVIKAIAFSDTGKELALARAGTELLRSHKDYSEQNPLEVWRSVVSVVRQVVGRCTEPISGIVSTAQGDGCWLVDSVGNPVRDAILWNDGRAHEIIERWHEKVLSTSPSASLDRHRTPDYRMRSCTGSPCTNRRS
jgi:xylulokinase